MLENPGQLFDNPPSEFKLGRYNSNIPLNWIKERIEKKWLEVGDSVSEYDFEEYVSSALLETENLHTKSVSVEVYHGMSLTTTGMPGQLLSKDGKTTLHYGMYLKVEFTVRGEDANSYSYSFSAHLSSMSVGIMVDPDGEKTFRGVGKGIDTWKAKAAKGRRKK